METLIAEDLLLLLLDDETGKQSGSSSSDLLIGGALLVQLALEGHVQLQPSTSRWQSDDDVVPAQGADPADPLLREALSRVGEKPRSAKDLVGVLGKNVRDVLLERLSQRGILDRQDDKVLGMFARTRWPAADSAHEDAIRHDLGRALLQDERPQPRIAALVALLHGGDQLGVLDTEGRSTKDVKKRAEQIAEGDWAGEAVGKAIQDALNAAMMAVITSAVIIPAAGAAGS